MYNWPTPQPMSEEGILNRAHGFWIDIISEFGADYLLNVGIEFDEVYEAIIYPEFEVYLEKNVNLGVDDFGEQILGRYIPKDNTALLDKKLFDTRDPRRVFTEWHEVAGHGVLQGVFLRKNAIKYDKLYTTDKSMKFIENSFERQANTFAANIAAPRSYVWCVFRKLFGSRRKIKYCGPGKYSLCFNDNTWFVSVSSPFELAWTIAKRIQHYFWGLSAEVIAYQLLEVAIDNNGYSRGSFSGCKFLPALGDGVLNIKGGDKK
jgi:hypothetical protein